jgi:hypothetical protein
MQRKAFKALRRVRVGLSGRVEVLKQGRMLASWEAEARMSARPGGDEDEKT